MPWHPVAVTVASSTVDPGLDLSYRAVRVPSAP
jgi:hypothetical protein